LVLKLDPQGADLVAASSEDLKRIRSQGEGWSENDLLRLLKIASESMWPMRDSPQPLLHLEAAVMQMATLESGEALADILERLQALEERLRGTAVPSIRGAGTGAGGSTPSRSTGAGGSKTEEPVGPRAAETATRYREPPAGSGTKPVVSADMNIAAALAAGTALEEQPSAGDVATEACWRKVVTAVLNRKKVLGAFLDESRLVGRYESELVLATDDLHRAVIEDKENRFIVAEELRRAFGERLILRCALAGQDTPRPPRAEDMQPMVERAIAWFHGEAIATVGRVKERTSES
jgi:DNA polymerase III gamma/tau subunit